MNNHIYDETFYNYQKGGAFRSAQVILPFLNSILSPKSVLDVGCGTGAWLSVHKEMGVADVVGIDGDYVDKQNLMINQNEFIPFDISTQFNLNRHFDLVQCLEVAEHIDACASEVFVTNLVAHGKFVLFSAAVPGQGGENHVNEQNYEYWRDLFLSKDYILFDFIRPTLVNNHQVEPWYRYNIMFFAHISTLEILPQVIISGRVADNSEIHDYSPLWYKIRKFIIRLLPVRALTLIAVLYSKIKVM